MKFIAIVTVGLVAGSLAMAQKVKSRGEGTAVLGERRKVASARGLYELQTSGQTG